MCQNTRALKRSMKNFKFLVEGHGLSQSPRDLVARQASIRRTVHGLVLRN